MVQVWGRGQLAAGDEPDLPELPAQVATWVGRPGLALKPGQYGLAPAEYERHEHAQQGRKWQGHGIDFEALLAKVTGYDPRIAASMRPMASFGLAAGVGEMPAACPPAAVHRHRIDRRAEGGRAVPVGQGHKGGQVRCLPVVTGGQLAAIRQAQGAVHGFDAHLRHPRLDPMSNLQGLGHALAKLRLTNRSLGTPGHDARHGFAARNFVAAPLTVRGTDLLACVPHRVIRAMPT